MAKREKERWRKTVKMKTKGKITNKRGKDERKRESRKNVNGKERKRKLGEEEKECEREGQKI